MERTNVEFLKKQLLKSTEKQLSLENISFNSDGILEAKYMILFDEDEAQESKTNMDEIMFAYISKIVGKEMTTEEVCDTLVTGKNEMPLWIKLSNVEGDKIFKLTISKRFRKKKVIDDWHKDNEMFPVIIKTT